MTGNKPQMYLNRQRKRGAYGAPHADIVRPIECTRAASAIASFSEYFRTPLLSLDGFAKRNRFGQVWYKDESGRFGIGSFKALGAPYAAARVLFGLLGLETADTTQAMAQILSQSFAEKTKHVVFASATDGNHGRALAWGASRFGCRCVIYVPRGVSENRVRAIEHYGATVRRIDGNYDDAVHAIAQDAKKSGWHVISDTAYPGYHDIPRDVAHGYTVMVAEAVSQLPQDERPTHVFVQAGVGALAAAVIGYLWNAWGEHCPAMVIVEPHNAACVYESATQGRPVRVNGQLSTLMGGLACGEVSELAWPLLRDGAHAFMTIGDEAAKQAMRVLARGVGGDPNIVGGESGVAGLAAAMVARGDAEISMQLHLDKNSRILVFGTEGATDPELYQSITRQG